MRAHHYLAATGSCKLEFTSGEQPLSAMADVRSQSDTLIVNHIALSEAMVYNMNDK